MHMQESNNIKLILMNVTRMFKVFSDINTMCQYRLKRCSKKDCCKQCRYVKFNGTMTKWPVQKPTQDMFIVDFILLNQLFLITCLKLCFLVQVMLPEGVPFHQFNVLPQIFKMCLKSMQKYIFRADIERICSAGNRHIYSHWNNSRKDQYW